jgi:hypothetical protein
MWTGSGARKTTAGNRTFQTLINILLRSETSSLFDFSGLDFEFTLILCKKEVSNSFFNSKMFIKSNSD